MDLIMDIGKKEIIEHERPHRFIDICQICEHEIDSLLDIDGEMHAACQFSLPLGYSSQVQQYEHNICTYGGCMPDLEYRHDNKPRGNVEERR